jgi:hypothetical protein
LGLAKFKFFKSFDQSEIVYRVSSRARDVRMRCRSKYLLIVLLLFLSICRIGAANSGFKERRAPRQQQRRAAVFFLIFDFDFVV